MRVIGGGSAASMRLQASRVRRNGQEVARRFAPGRSDRLRLPRSVVAAQRSRARGLTPCANSISLAADRSARGLVGEEEQGTRAAPDDLLTSYPGTGRKSALLGRVRTCQGACLVSSPTLAVRGHSASPHPVPALALGWSVHHARRGIRTAAPGSCAEGRFQDRRRLISEARAEKHISQRPSCSVSIHPQPQKLVPGLCSARGYCRGQTLRV